jgi:hypothetical protein
LCGIVVAYVAMFLLHCFVIFFSFKFCIAFLDGCILLLLLLLLLTHCCCCM